MTKSNSAVAEPKRASKLVSKEMHPTTDLIEYVKEYSRANPEMAACWCLGIGFLLGWKLKLW